MPARPRMAALGLMVVALLLPPLAVTACAEEAEPQSKVPARSGRFGIFRDLVLIRRPAREGGAFFLDRFETTIADWSAYERTTGWTPVDAAVLTDMRPKAQVSLPEARRYARWRFCRLPREAEWQYAATQGGSTDYPWGSRWKETWANTHGLNLERVTEVGSFESGKTPTGIYDLLGNVAEWTETVDLQREKPGDPPVFVYELPGEFPVSQSPGLHCWLLTGTPVPLEWLVMADYGEVPRKVLGGSFYTSVSSSSSAERLPFPAPVSWLPGRRDAHTGLRLAASPGDLLRALVESGVTPNADERARLLRFVRQPDHQEVLGVAWRWLVAGGDFEPHRSGSLYVLLEDELSR